MYAAFGSALGKKAALPHLPQGATTGEIGEGGRGLATARAATDVEAGAGAKPASLRCIGSHPRVVHEHALGPKCVPLPDPTSFTAEGPDPTGRCAVS